MRIIASFSAAVGSTVSSSRLVSRISLVSCFFMGFLLRIVYLLFSVVPATGKQATPCGRVFVLSLRGLRSKPWQSQQLERERIATSGFALRPASGEPASVRRQSHQRLRLRNDKSPHRMFGLCTVRDGKTGYLDSSSRYICMYSFAGACQLKSHCMSRCASAFHSSRAL